MIMDTKQLVEGEIWSVTFASSVSSSKVPEIFYVLESTCEVIGYPSIALDSTRGLSQPSIPVRVDWSDYIGTRLLPSSSLDSPLPPLMEHLKWMNHEEYSKGISHLWLRRIRNEGELGLAKRVVAERYVLACVVGNRFVV